MQYLIGSAESYGPEVELHHQERQVAFRGEQPIGNGLEHKRRRVDASAEFCTLACRATEADFGDVVCMRSAVVHSGRLLDVVGPFELCVHAFRLLVPEADDFTNFKVALLLDAR